MTHCLRISKNRLNVGVMYAQNHPARSDEKIQLFKYFPSMFVGILIYNRAVTPNHNSCPDRKSGSKKGDVQLLMAFYAHYPISVGADILNDNMSKITRCAKRRSLQSAYILVYMIYTIPESCNALFCATANETLKFPHLQNGLKRNQVET